MITCALLSRCSGSLSLITTSWALAGFWARKGVCPWWTVVVPLKNFCPRATVASAHASLNRSCSVVELFQALVLCFYQLQAAAVVVGRSAAESSSGGCEAQAALPARPLGAVVAHGVGLQRAVLRLVVFGEPSSGIQRRFRRYATPLGARRRRLRAALRWGAVRADAAGRVLLAMLTATSDGLWDRLCCVPKVGDRAERRGSAKGLELRETPGRRAAAAGRAASSGRRRPWSLESFADEGLEEDEEKKVWSASAGPSSSRGRGACSATAAGASASARAPSAPRHGVGFHGFIGLAVFAKASDVRRGAARVGGGAAPAPVGAAGLPNKGAVAALVTFHDATLLFVGCHLPADGKAGAKLKKRHAAVRDALARAAEGLGVRGPAATCDAHLGAATHTFFLGDLNYRARRRRATRRQGRPRLDADAHDDPAAATDADARTRARYGTTRSPTTSCGERPRASSPAFPSRPSTSRRRTATSPARAAASEGYAHAPLLAAARADLFSLVKEKKRRGGGEPSDVAASRAAEQRLAENPKLTISAAAARAGLRPPSWTALDYDYVNKRARAAVLLGLDAGKNFTRRYDAAQEYAVRGEPYPDCKRSYLGEAMPMPAYPSTAALAEADVDIDGSRHERWLVDIPGAERTHVYTNEALVDGAYVPLMTYDFVEFEAVAPAEAAFDLGAVDEGDLRPARAAPRRRPQRRRPAPSQ
ncbi:hypothetical protein JL720_7056 [Aureococcus anophagefferens]|nr:hypothetical protein JL720_7056 [Aureococcus anophagefferens]